LDFERRHKDEPPGGRWTIKKEFSVGDVLAFLFAGSAILLAYGKLDTRTTVLEQSRLAQERRDETQDLALTASIAELKSYLYRIEDKVDKLHERSLNK
jgi:hypothetical protein